MLRAVVSLDLESLVPICTAFLGSQPVPVISEISTIQVVS